MTEQELTLDITDWIYDFLNVAQPALGGHKVCPFAATARWRAQVGTDPSNDLINLATHWDDGKDVVVLAYDPQVVSARFLEQAVEQANLRVLIPIDLLALEDHPDDLESVNGVIMNNGKYAIILVQRFSKIDAAACSLRPQGYYATWPKDYYDRVAGWREQHAPVGYSPKFDYRDGKAKYNDQGPNSTDFQSTTQIRV